MGKQLMVKSGTKEKEFGWLCYSHFALVLGALFCPYGNTPKKDAVLHWISTGFTNCSWATSWSELSWIWHLYVEWHSSLTVRAIWQSQRLVQEGRMGGATSHLCCSLHWNWVNTFVLVGSCLANAHSCWHCKKLFFGYWGHSWRQGIRTCSNCIFCCYLSSLEGSKSFTGPSFIPVQGDGCPRPVAGSCQDLSGLAAKNAHSAILSFGRVKQLQLEISLNEGLLWGWRLFVSLPPWCIWVRVSPHLLCLTPTIYNLRHGTDEKKARKTCTKLCRVVYLFLR